VAAKKRARLSWGSIRTLPSGRLQVRYLHNGIQYTAPMTFAGNQRGDAETFLAITRAAIANGTWKDPDAPGPKRPLTFGEHAEDWMTHRQLAPRTRQSYRAMLESFAYPTFKDVGLADITPADIRKWINGLETGEVYRRRTFVFIKTVFGDAVKDDLLVANPCRNVEPPKPQPPREVRVLTPAEIGALADAVPEQYSAMIWITAYCALRYGEVAALERRDIDLKKGRLHVRRGVVQVTGQGMVVGQPKTRAGIRTVAIPPHILPIVEQHLKSYVPEVPNTALLFPDRNAQHMADSTFRWHWNLARAKAGLSDLHFHDLRHNGATLAAQAGATLAELMGRLGHSTPSAAMRYQHVAKDRDQMLAKRMSELAES
jgi:integrase